MSTWSKFILLKMQEREKELGRRVTNKEFGEWLNVSASTISQWVNGKYPPSLDIVPHIAEKLGPGVYDVLNLSRPDPELRYINNRWDNLPDDARRQIHEIVERYDHDHDKK